MNNIFNKKEITNVEEYEVFFKKYDAIVGATMTNIYSLSKNSPDIIFNNFKSGSPTHRVFLESALFLIATNQKSIGLHMPAIKYFFFRNILMRKRKNVLFRVKEAQKDGINIEEVAGFEAEAFETTTDVFADIYDTYYKKIYRKV